MNDITKYKIVKVKPTLNCKKETEQERNLALLPRQGSKWKWWPESSGGTCDVREPPKSRLFTLSFTIIPTLVKCGYMVIKSSNN